MKRTLSFAINLAISTSLISQTNIFPTTGNVGIGTLSPASLLEIYGGGNLALRGSTNDAGDLLFQTSTQLQLGRIWTASAGTPGIYFSSGDITPDLSIDNNGKIGIGTTSPNTKLEVNGIARFTGTRGFSIGDDAGQFRIQNYGSGQEFGFLNSGNGYAGIRVRSSSIGTDYGGITAPTNGAIIQGNVGIGTSTPTEKLEVNGTIRTKKVKVKATGWPDYVFADSYQLMAINQLEKYIKANKHLPGVPSAKEIETNGLDLGAMDATLLKKVEELTLYLIELEAGRQKLEAENQNLKKRLSQIEDFIKSLNKQ